MVNITRIQLFGNVKGYLDVTEETIIPLTIAVSDIRDVSSKTGTFSKSIKIKGTKNNNKLLNHYFDVNVEAGTFNINKRQECAILQNGVNVLDNAIVQLISVNKLEKGDNYDEQVEYTVLVRDTTSDFFSIINSKFLDELDLGIPNMVYTADNVVASFDNTYTDGYKFIMPYNPTLKFNLEEFKPGIYVRRYFDAIFTQATGDTIDSGFRYNFPDINDSAIQFNKLIIPYNGDEAKNGEGESDVVVSAQTNTGNIISARKVSINAQNIGTVFHYHYNQVPTTVNINSELFDPDGLYNPLTSTYTPPFLPSNSNTVQYEYTIDYDYVIQNNDVVPVYIQNVYDKNVKIYPDASQVNLVFNLGLFNTANVNKVTLLNGSLTQVPNGTAFAVGPTTFPGGTHTFKTSFPLTVNEGLVMKSELKFPPNANGILKATFLKTLGNLNTSSNNVRMDVRINNIKLNIRQKISDEYGYNVPLKFNRFIPTKIKQSDFIKGLFTMFNLYCILDKDDPKKFNIYRRDGFYDSGVAKDWTTKLVKDDNKEIRFLPELTSKRLILSYKQDKDYPNENFELGTNEVYGQQQYVFKNEYVKNIQRIEPIFSPTPMVDNNSTTVVPYLIGNAPKTNIRILIDGGKLSCSEYSIINYDKATPLKYSVYPYVNHTDKPNAPTFDINFGKCDYYYRGDSNITTDNNLYILHWQRTLNLIDKGKMLIGKFVLDESDISSLALNDKILVDNSWWNINKVIDYDANSAEPTKVELISFDDFEGLPFSIRAPRTSTVTSGFIRNPWWDMIRTRLPFVNPFANITWPIRGFNNTLSNSIRRIELNGDDNVLGTGNFEVYGDNNIANDTASIFGDFNTSYFERNTIFGNYNIISGTTNRTFGDNNVIEGDNNIVLGDSNYIPSGVTNAIILGRNLSATTGNTLYAENITLPADGKFIIGDTVYDEHTFTLNSASLSTGLYEFGGGGIVITSPTTFNVGNVKGWIVDSHDVLNANPHFVDFSGATGMTTPFLNVAPATYVLISSGDTVLLQATFPTTTDRRNNIYLGVIGHPVNELTGVGNAPEIIMNEMSQVRAMFEPMKFINGGVTVYNFANNLQLANTSGLLYGLGIGFIPNGNDSPTVLTISAGTPTTFQYRTMSGGTFANTTLIDPLTYDVNGTATPVPNPAQTATNQRFYLLQNGFIRAQFGQTTYANLAAAVAGAQTEQFAPFSNNTNLGILIGILSIQKNCLNLADTTTCRFLSVSKFGESVGSAGGVSTASLQSAYNNSINPEIVTNSVLGAFSLVRGSASDNDNVFEILNGAVQLKTRIDGNGNVLAQSFIKSGGTSSQFLMADGSVTSGGTNIDTTALHKTGNESFTGTKSSTLTGVTSALSFINNAAGNAIDITNNLNGMGLNVTNTNQGNGIQIIHNTANSTGIGLYIDSINTGTGIRMVQRATSDGITLDNISSKTGIVVNSSGGNSKGIQINNTLAGVQQNAFTYAKNTIPLVTLSDTGSWLAQSFIKSGGTNTQFLMADGSVSTGSTAIDTTALHKTGNESWTGTKSSIASGSSALFLTNLETSFPAVTALQVENANTSVGTGVRIINNSNTSSAKALHVINNSTDVNTIGFLCQSEQEGLAALITHSNDSNGLLISNGTSVGYSLKIENSVASAITSNNCVILNNMGGFIQAPPLIYLKQAVQLTSINDNGTINAQGFIKNGGTNLQYLMADGSVTTSTSSATLQSAYNSSTSPEIITNNTLGAVTLRRGSSADTNNVIEIQNGGGTTTAKIDGNGLISGTSFVKTGAGGDVALMGNGTVLALSKGSFSAPVTSSPAGLAPIFVSNSLFTVIGDVVTYNLGFTVDVTATTVQAYTITFSLPFARSSNAQRMIGQGNFFGGLTQTSGVVDSSSTTQATIIMFKSINGIETIKGNISIQYSPTI